MLNTVTPLILTFNEEANIRRTLDALSWASQVVVVDSFSTDATRAICAEYSKVRFLHREFDQHAAQWNYGLSQLDEHGWALALDADHTALNMSLNLNPTSHPLTEHRLASAGFVMNLYIAKMVSR